MLAVCFSRYHVGTMVEILPGPPRHARSPNVSRGQSGYRRSTSPVAVSRILAEYIREGGLFSATFTERHDSRSRSEKGPRPNRGSGIVRSIDGGGCVLLSRRAHGTRTGNGRGPGGFPGRGRRTSSITYQCCPRETVSRNSTTNN